MPLHTDSETHRRFYTQFFYTQTLLHKGPFYTQTASEHKHFYTRTRARTNTHTPLTDVFAHRRRCPEVLYTQVRLHTRSLVHRQLRSPSNSQKGCRRTILHSLLTIEPHFVRKSGHFVTPRRRRPRPGEEKKRPWQRARGQGRQREGERERERERERKKILRCDDVTWTCVDEKRWEDVKCEGERIWRGIANHH